MADLNSIALDLEVRVQNADSIKELRDAIKEVDEAIKAFCESNDCFEKFSQTTEKATNTLRSIATIAGQGLQKSISAAIEFGEKLEEGFEKAGAAAKLFGASNEVLEGAISKVHNAVVLLQGAQAALNLVMNASPIGLIVTAVVALVAIISSLKTATDEQREAQHLHNEELEQSMKKHEQEGESAKKAGDLKLQLAQTEKKSITEIAQIKQENNTNEQKNIQQHLQDLKGLKEGHEKELANTTKEADRKRLQDLIDSENKQIEVTKQKGQELINESITIERERQEALHNIQEQADRLHIANMTDAHQRELASLKEDLKEKLETIVGNSPEEQQLRRELEVSFNEKVGEVNRKYALEQAKTRNQILIAGTKEGSEERLRAEEEAIKNELAIELKNASLTADQKQLLRIQAQQKLDKLESEFAQKKLANDKAHIEAELELEETAGKKKQNAKQLAAAASLKGDQTHLKLQLELLDKEYEAQRKAALAAGQSVEKIDADYLAKKQNLYIAAGQKQIDEDNKKATKALQDEKKHFETELKQIENEKFARQYQSELKASTRLSASRKKEMDDQMRLAEANYRLQQQAAGDNADKLQKISEDYEKAKTDIQVKYGKQQIEEEQKDAKAKEQILQEGLSMVQSVGNLLGAEGKKQKDIKKGLALAHIAIDTGKAIGSLVAASNENPLNATTFGAAGIAQFAVGIAEILGNIAQAKQILSGGDDDSGGGGSSTPSISSSGGNSSSSSSSGLYSAAQSSMGLTPQVNNTPAQGTNMDRSKAEKNRTDSQSVRVYVTETDITTAQKRVSKLHKGSVM